MPGRIFLMAAETNHIGCSKDLLVRRLSQKPRGGVKNKEGFLVTTVVTRVRGNLPRPGYSRYSGSCFHWHAFFRGSNARRVTSE